jgi:hypothetical protein
VSARHLSRSGSRRGSRINERIAPAAVEVLERVARVLRGTGVTPRQMRDAFVRICRKLPPPSRADREATEIIDAAHLLTLWFRDREFLNTGGAPRPLPLRGRGPSLDRLIRRVNPALPVTEVTRYLVRAGAVRRVRQGYVPVHHALSLRRLYGPQRARALRPLVSILRTLEHNMKPMSEVEGWFEWIAENPCVPVRALQKLDAKLDRYGMNLLRAFDIDMLQEEETRKAGERTVRLGIGIYRFEDREEHRKAERGRVEVPARSQRDRRPTPSIRRVGRERRVRGRQAAVMRGGGHTR